MLRHGHVSEAMAAGPVKRPAARARATAPLGFAGVLVAALALTWVVAELVPAGQARDSLALYHFVLLSRPHVDLLANDLLRLLDLPGLVLWTVALVAVALARGRPRVALAVAVVMALAPLSSEALKPLLAHPHVPIGTLHINDASWPSGHSTAALALALCAVLVSPAHLRLLVTALGAVFALAVGFSLLILAWHMPSDVLGGYLLAALWMALAVAGLRAAERRWPSAPGSHPG
ncbi:MAG: phosphatase PAP2 family protein [Solirubrobacteraceae bacterium]